MQWWAWSPVEHIYARSDLYRGGPSRSPRSQAPVGVVAQG
ncbi:hypothetical protein BN2537_6775 [Streptomyces venezuelae]|nr:hypothetical protein BN2537_6775 [Streptomyces venezuelae]